MSKSVKRQSNALLAKAIAALNIDDVSLISSSSMLADGIEPKYNIDPHKLSYQTKHRVSSSEVHRVADDEETHFLFKVNFELGVRIGDSEELSSKENPEIIAVIEANMAAYYTIKDPEIIKDQEALDEFALKNSSFHIWPYWREFVSAQLSRMNMPKITLPFSNAPGNRSTST